ncbi:hypothetical protein [Chromobacterium amazonense]|uniref:hypothetical protein n=1 Tax=Chromobacterium amazonense TaxID=1382803 RepID=UPI003F78B089
MQVASSPVEHISFSQPQQSNNSEQVPEVSSSVLTTVNIPLSMTRPEFCERNFSNICGTCRNSGDAAQVMSRHLDYLLGQVGTVGSGYNAKFEVLDNLTHNLLPKISSDDLDNAQDAARQIQTHFHSETDSQGRTRLDRTLNTLDLPYHKATHDSGRMGHAREMQNDVGHFFNDHPYHDLAEMLAYCHDHVQIQDDRGMGVGNSQHFGLNEIATAAAMATLAAEAGVNEAGQAALLKVAGVVIPAGTAFNFMPGVGGSGKPGLGTTIEGMLRSSTLPVNLSSSAQDAVAMAYTLAVCDTQRNNLAGLIRPTDESIRENAPDVYRMLLGCSEKDPNSFGTTFFENGQLSKAGLALCSKLSTTVEVFEEFPPNTFSTPDFKEGKPNNPLSKTFDSSSLTAEERSSAILLLIEKNGAFGSADVMKDIESFSKTFSHPVFKGMKESSLFPKGDPKSVFADAYVKFSKELKEQCGAGTVKLDAVLTQMKAMSGSIEA